MRMKSESERLFINNLPSNITQAELHEKFAEYGAVTSVEIKERKNVTSNQALHFAYIQLIIEQSALQNCLEEFSSGKWKGHWIDLKIAKESFMERLKREREQMKSNGVAKSPASSVPDHRNGRTTINSTVSTSSAVPASGVPIYPDQLNEENDILQISRPKGVRKYHSSSSESSEDHEIVNTAKSIQKDNHTSKSESVLNEDPADEFIIKNNRGLTITKGLKIDPIKASSSVSGVKEQSKKVSAVQVQANKKRLESIVQMKQAHLHRKSLIQDALAHIDSKPKNKIVFNDDDDETRGQDRNKNHEVTTTNDKVQTRVALFEDAEDEHEAYNFESKEHFEGKKGRKLMELQSRFKNDKRFAMDARFLENEPEDDDNNETQENEEISPENEKEKQFEILEQVLGKKVYRKSADNKTNDSKKPKMMLRFDPSLSEHSKYEIKEPVKREKTKRKRKESEQIEAKVAEDAPKPEVSKDTYYKVAVNLKDALEQNQEFSLANLFNKEIETAEQEVNQHLDNESTKSKKKKLTHEPNPFRYDSSTDDESESEKKHDEPVIDDSKKSTNSDLLQRAKAVRVWSDPFFFKDDDYRLQEGFDFIKKLELQEPDHFGSIRRNLKVIIKAKVKNNQRNNRPFKRKLGGKKRIRVKRALKR